MRGMCAPECLEVSELGGKAWQNQKRRILLRVGAESKLWGSNARSAVPQPELEYVWEKPEGDLGCPRSAGCSRTSSASALRAGAARVHSRHSAPYGERVAHWAEPRGVHACAPWVIFRPPRRLT
eukprot:5637790-Pleurochrysis_carterae.AAC.2